VHSAQPRQLLQRPIVRAAIALALLAPLLVLLVFVRASGDDEPSGEGPTRVPGVELGALDSRSPKRGEPAPNFRLETADGGVTTLEDLRGKVVWINFWATWCRPCRRELPDIQKLYDEKRSEGLEVLTVNIEESAEEARAFFDDLGVAMPLLLDENGEVYDQYGLRGLPDSFFVDRDGNLAAMHIGYLTEEIARERLAAAGLP
jgi:peroxiredoxin